MEPAWKYIPCYINVITVLYLYPFAIQYVPRNMYLYNYIRWYVFCLCLSICAWVGYMCVVVSVVCLFQGSFLFNFVAICNVCISRLSLHNLVFLFQLATRYTMYYTIMQVLWLPTKLTRFKMVRRLWYSSMFNSPILNAQINT